MRPTSMCPTVSSLWNGMKYNRSDQLSYFFLRWINIFYDLDTDISSTCIALRHVRLAYKSYFFQSMNIIFLSQQISQRYFQPWLISQANRTHIIFPILGLGPSPVDREGPCQRRISKTNATWPNQAMDVHDFDIWYQQQHYATSEAYIC